LGSLRDKIENATFESKRQLVMSLVDKVTVDTIEESRRRAVRIRIEYCFSNPGDRPPDRHHGGNDPGGDGNDIAYCVTGPVRPQEAEYLAWVHGEVKVINGSQLPVLLAEVSGSDQIQHSPQDYSMRASRRALQMLA